MKTKTIISLLLFSALLSEGYAQSYISKTIQYDGETRNYDIYVPAIYDGTTQVPLIFNFHGGNGDIASQVAIADMSSLSDTANFIVVYPQALPDPNDGGSTNWLHKDPTTVDDVFFVDALIDTLAAAYQIDAGRIYACGYSLGGEFTFELGCRLNNKIAAIGVVARTMQTVTFNNCSPVHPTGVLTILGTADAISDYNGIWFGGVQYYLSADEVHDYWVAFNNCDTAANLLAVPDINTSDGSTVERYTWSDATGCSYVEHLKVIGGGHDWPGSFGNMDIDATEEIWNFVSQYDANGRIGCGATSVSEPANLAADYIAYPNPFAGRLMVETGLLDPRGFKLWSVLGELVLSGRLDSTISEFDLSSLPPDIYFLQIEDQIIKLVKTE